jgi:hypothetical protein
MGQEETASARSAKRFADTQLSFFLIVRWYSGM